MTTGGGCAPGVALGDAETGSIANPEIVSREIIARAAIDRYVPALRSNVDFGPRAIFKHRERWFGEN